LAAGNRDAYLPNLATSLCMFALVRQLLVVELEKSIAAASEDEAMFAELTAAEPDAFTERRDAVAKIVALHTCHLAKDRSACAIHDWPPSSPLGATKSP